jgi:RNA polymerase sigma factor (sigma-70 family)
MNRSHDLALTDEQLVATCTAQRKAKADHDAQGSFQLLYQRHARPLLAFLATRVRRDSLEDVQQTIWLRIWEHMDEQFTGGNFRAYLFTIARRYLIDLSRRRQADTAEDAHGWQDTRSPSVLDNLIAQEEPHLVGLCLKHLGEEEVLVVRGRLSGESYEAICQHLEIAPAKAYKLYHEALQKLQTCVERSTR